MENNGWQSLKQSIQKFRHVTALSALGGSPVGSCSRGESSDAKPVSKVVPTSIKATEIQWKSPAIKNAHDALAEQHVASRETM